MRISIPIEQEMHQVRQERKKPNLCQRDEEKDRLFFSPRSEEHRIYHERHHEIERSDEHISRKRYPILSSERCLAFYCSQPTAQHRFEIRHKKRSIPADFDLFEFNSANYAVMKEIQAISGRLIYPTCDFAFALRRGKNKRSAREEFFVGHPIPVKLSYTRL